MTSSMKRRNACYTLPGQGGQARFTFDRPRRGGLSSTLAARWQARFYFCALDEWKAALKAGTDSGESQALQRYTRTGRPLVDAPLLAWGQIRVKRDVQSRSRGCPRGSKDSYKRTRKRG